MATLSEIGTHATIGAAMGPVRTDERTLAEEVIDIDLRAGMLLEPHRGFYSYELWTEAAATGADLLWRVSKGASPGGGDGQARSMIGVVHPRRGRSTSVEPHRGCP